MGISSNFDRAGVTVATEEAESIPEIPSQAEAKDGEVDGKGHVCKAVLTASCMAMVNASSPRYEKLEGPLRERPTMTPDESHMTTDVLDAPQSMQRCRCDRDIE